MIVYQLTIIVLFMLWTYLEEKTESSKPQFYANLSLSSQVYAANTIFPCI